MKIRTKMLSLLALLFAALTLLEIGIQKQVVLPSFAELERDDARMSMKRIDNALGSALDGLALSAADWGNWADVYEYVKAPTQDFLDKNITAPAMKQLQVDTLIIIDRTGRLVLSRARDLRSGAALDLDLAALASLPAGFPWRSNLASGEPAQGLIETNLGVMMIAAAPVLDGSGAGQSIGMVILGKLVTPQVVQQLGAQALADLALVSGRGDQGAERVSETDDVTRVDRPFRDIAGRPLMSLRVEVPRKITVRGQRAVAYASAYLVGAGVAVLALAMFLLNRVVLEPLARVTRHAVAMGEGDDLTARLGLSGRDEVATLAREFDRMVERVAAGRRQLVDRSFESGFAELAKGVLHNLGNAMTPLGVRLSKMDDRLRHIPLEDIDRAVGELRHATPAAARRADLEEFVRLACVELADTVREARNDVQVIQRQSMTVQTALAELMRSTRNEHVLESVLLPDLVQQTLEIVPDACRRRLDVEADASLRNVGMVRVARTVLRLVLQNLLINAADAVRDAGREKGVFRVAAEIVHEADEDRLHLRCEDNGVGIERADLERVFEQGFSTKSRDTNYGIGLHWCANAIAALGGRIWAVSAGRGQGTALHLMLPLPARDAVSIMIIPRG